MVDRDTGDRQRIFHDKLDRSARCHAIALLPMARHAGSVAAPQPLPASRRCVMSSNYDRRRERARTRADVTTLDVSEGDQHCTA